MAEAQKLGTRETTVKAYKPPDACDGDEHLGVVEVGVELRLRILGQREQPRSSLRRRAAHDRRCRAVAVNHPVRVTQRTLVDSMLPDLECRRTADDDVDDLWGTGRLEAFSDGVFAIAITLLILEINVPESSFDNLWQGIADQWPSYLAYATSFLTIGGIWLVHHGIVRRLQYANRQLMVVNLVLLMLVSFLPFPTKLMAEAIHNVDAARAAVIFYGAILFVISLVLWLFWTTITRDRRVLRPEVSEKEIATIARAATPNLGFYAAVIALALIAPKVAVFGYLAIAIVALMRVRGDRTPAPPTPA